MNTESFIRNFLIVLCFDILEICFLDISDIKKLITVVTKKKDLV